MKEFIQRNKVHVIIWTIGIIVLGFYLYKEFTTPTYLVRGFLLNTEAKQESESIDKLTKDFIKEYQIDTDRGEVLFDASYICEPDNDKLANETSEAIHQIFIGQGEQTLDFVLGPNDVLKTAIYESHAGGMSIFADLSSVLSDAQIELYEPNFLYIDLDVVEQLEEAYDKDKDISSIALPDMTDPKAMKTPVPVMIDISNSPKLASIYGEKVGNLSFVLLADSPSQALAMNFLEYITLEEQ